MVGNEEDQCKYIARDIFSLRKVFEKESNDGLDRFQVTY